MRRARILACALLLCTLAMAQGLPPVGTFSQVLFPLLTSLPPVTNANVVVVGNPGNSTYYYWLVTNYTFGQTSPQGPFVVINAPAVLSSGNYIAITPGYLPGATVDVLKTTSISPPTGTGNYALSTGNTSGTINDQGGGLSSYVINPINVTNYGLCLSNQVAGAAQAHLILGLGPECTFVADLSAIGTSTGTVTAITGTSPIIVTPSPLTTTGVISFASSGVTPGSYTSANLTVDTFGRVTAAANGSGGGGVSGSGTGGVIAGWSGSGASTTLGNSPCSFAGAFATLSCVMTSSVLNPELLLTARGSGGGIGFELSDQVPATSGSDYIYGAAASAGGTVNPGINAAVGQNNFFWIQGYSGSAYVTLMELAWTGFYQQPGGNGHNFFAASRATDISPTGNYLDLQNAAASAHLFTVDVSGNTTLGTGAVLALPMTGTTCLQQISGVVTPTGGPCGSGGGGTSIEVNGGSALTSPVNFQNGTSGNAINFSNPSGSNIQATIQSASVTNAMLVNPSTTVNGQTCTLGSTCTISASGTVNNALQYSAPYYSASGTANTISGVSPPTTNGNWVLVANVTGGVAVAPAFTLAGVGSRAVVGTTSTDTILYSDNTSRVGYQGSVAVAVSLPTPTTLGNQAFATRITNNTTGSSTAVTVTPVSFLINGASTLSIAQNESCLITVDASGAFWNSDCSQIGGGGSSAFPITVSGTVTSGGIPYFNTTTQESSSALLAANGLVLGGGAGTAPFTTAGISSNGSNILILGVAGSSIGGLSVHNATSGTLTIAPPAGALGTVTNTLQAVADTFVYRSTTDTLTNKTLTGPIINGLASPLLAASAGSSGIGTKATPIGEGNFTQVTNTDSVVYGSITTIGNTGFLMELLGTPAAPADVFTVDVSGNLVNTGSATVSGNVTINGAGGLASPNGPISSGSTSLTATACPSGVTGCVAAAEGSTAGTPTAGVDYIRADSTNHCFEYSTNGGAEACLGTNGGGSTVGVGGIWSSGVPLHAGNIAQTTGTPTNNSMFGSQLFTGNTTQVVGHATFGVHTGGTAETAYACIYNAAGTTLLWSASVAVNSSTTAASASATQFTLLPNTEYLVTTEQTGTTGAVLSVYATTADVDRITNLNGTRYFTTANVVSGAACPTTTGALTASTAATLAAVALEP